LRLLEKSIHGELFYSSQASYLLDAGITELVLEKSDPQDVEHFIPISNALQKLLSEAEMGELFKVIAFGKNLTQLKLRLTQLPGLSGRNRVY
jgi:SAM-dependent MidA family methyltransferase